MLPRLPHCSPLGRLLKNAWISGTRGKSPDFTVALVIGFMTEEGQASRLCLLPCHAARPPQLGDLRVETTPRQIRHFADGVRVFYGRFPVFTQEPQSL